MNKSMERIWEEYAKKKFPLLSKKHPEYTERRKAYFVGAWAVLGAVINCPDNAFDYTMRDLMAEIKAVVMEGRVRAPINGN